MANVLHPNDASEPVPYISKLGAPLIAGQSIHIHGNINEDANRVTINLLSGSPEVENGTAVLHCDFRFDEGKLVTNSFIDGVWGKEERESVVFKKGQAFDFKLRVLEDKYEIRLNGVKSHVYKHRVPFSTVEYFQVKGDASLNGVHWGGKHYDLPWETGFANASLQAGQRVFIQVIPTGDRFNVDLIARNGDILFHFNPRFGEKKIVRNAQKADVWGEEEREGPFPFKKDVASDISIVNEPYSIQIFVDKQHLLTFAHRTDNPSVDYIGMRIGGEADILNVEFAN